jgi:hypothetical protein
VAQIASGGPRLNRGAFLVALVAGAAGVLVPIVPAVSGLLLWFFPPIGVAVLAAWAWLTVRWRRRGGFPMRRWAAVTWFLLVGPLTLLVTIAFLPPGSGLPEGDDARRLHSPWRVPRCWRRLRSGRAIDSRRTRALSRLP